MDDYVTCPDCGDDYTEDCARVVHPNDHVTCQTCDLDYTEQERC